MSEVAVHIAGNRSTGERNSNEPPAFSTREQTTLKNALENLIPNDSALQTCAQHHFAQSGKMLRGQLALMTGDTLGISAHAALAWAMSVELMHNASLVHDDICDKDETRRGKASVWAAFGAPTAICFGDWLTAQSFAHAAQAEVASGTRGLVSMAAQAMADLSCSQAHEFRQMKYPDWKTYEQIVTGKTVPLLTAGILGTLSMTACVDTQINNAVDKTFAALGQAYQIANDIDNFTGDDGHENLNHDLANAAPNAVIIIFRDGLKNGSRLAFDAWLEDPARIGASHWRDRILQTDAVQHTTDQVSQRLVVAHKSARSLPEDLRQIIAPLYNYLLHTCTSMGAQATGHNFQ